MHPLRQLAAIFQEEATVASTPVATALSSIAGRLERLASELEDDSPVPPAPTHFPEVHAPEAAAVEPPKKEKPDAKAKD